MTEEIAIGNALLQIAEKLDVRAQYIFEIIVKAQMYSAILTIILMLSVVIAYCIAFYIIYNKIFTASECYHDYPMRVILSGVYAAIPTGLYFMVAYAIKCSLMAILCPEYTALNEIINSMSRLV